ncbi:hypothetical protein E2C01_054409 [Portunus trituberculatus]|uniref:Uncharacterized protein n=1 Tax=Portunus trituberculatus TaxID=210409 RepID=A0A5B7GRW4_PORTR|nr:hypothetical protein [Portunus trituberculatus]
MNNVYRIIIEHFCEYWSSQSSVGGYVCTLQLIDSPKRSSGLTMAMAGRSAVPLLILLCLATEGSEVHRTTCCTLLLACLSSLLTSASWLSSSFQGRSLLEEEVDNEVRHLGVSREIVPT